MRTTGRRASIVPAALVVAVLAVAVGTGGCAGEPDPWGDARPVGDGDTVEVGERVVLLVGENPSVGDALSTVEDPDPDVLREVGAGIHRDEAADDLDGAGHQRWYAYEAVGAGTGTLVLFNCWRCHPDEPNDEPFTREITFTLEVGDR